MSAFVDYLSSYLVNELSGALAAAPGRELRVFFSGPPAKVLDQMFTSLLAGGEFLTINDQYIPVFILDASAQDPDRLCSGRCSSNHLVKVRTSGCRVFIALIPPDQLTNVSIDTTFTWVGIRESIRDFQTWAERPMIRNLKDAAIGNFFSTNQNEGARDALSFALSEAWESDESHEGQPNTWQVLERLFNYNQAIPANEESFLAILGLPMCGNHDLGSPEHLKVLARIADLFENSGLNPGFSILEDQVDDELRPHIKHLRHHILSKCMIPAHFSGAPAKHYSPINDITSIEIQKWWRALTLDVWNRLLDSPSERTVTKGFKVDFVDPLTPNVHGLPVLFRNKVAIILTLHTDAGSVTVNIRRAIGAKQLDDIAKLNLQGNTPAQWVDTSVPPHERYVRYELEAEGYKRTTLKCIVIDQYSPGVAVYSRNAIKITPFKLNKKARDIQGHRLERYECDLALHGMGAHQLDLYTGTQVSLGARLTGYEVTSEKEEVVDKPINLTNEFHAVCVIETDEECYYDFLATHNGRVSPSAYRIWVTTEDQAPTGASSEFDRLLIEHRASANGDRVNARVQPATSRASDLEIWAIEGPASYCPLVLGPDFLDFWRKPIWTERPILSGHRLMLDPRPPATEFQPSPELISARQRIQSFLRPNPSEATLTIEMVQLAVAMANPGFASAVVDYLHCYVDWLHTDYTAAVWMDVITVHRVEASGDVLEPVPAAILLTPLHPLRLAWQCRAQGVLKEALDKHARCPGASVLDPCSFPDSIMLPCRLATGRTENHSYLSLVSNSDYWSVLWNKDIVPSLGTTVQDSIFNSEFGIIIEGLSTGFSVQQVKRSIEEVGRLSAAKSTLQVSIESDTGGSSSCNEGIDKWCTENLGVDSDPWFEAGPRSLHVHDYRPINLQPEQSSLASLTSKTGATVRWFTPEPGKSRQQSDLAIIAHLGVSSPAFQIEGLRSGVDPTGLSRHRIRKQLAATAGIFIAESRVGAAPKSSDLTTLNGLLLACVDKLESTCTQCFDSYVFAPKTPTLEEALQSARYCAVSSSTVDAACFFRATMGSYLWDYELPAYSRRAGENNGYYLLAKESPNIIQAVHSAVRKIAPDETLDSAQVSNLLKEISRRGMPTLKRLTSGGATSLGEIGMLVALRVLQSEFEISPQRSGLCPVRVGEDILNLIIPADPFKNHFEDLQTAIGARSGERPDLIVASIRFVTGKPARLRLTPIEVKARSDVFSYADRLAALSQASSFSRFLTDVQILAQRITLWSITWRSLVASWVDYAFRVYGQLECFMRHDEWSKLHSDVINGLMSEEIIIDIDLRGRLIAIDNSNASTSIDTDSDQFKETIILTHSDAYSMISGEKKDLVSQIKTTLGDWELSPAVSDQMSASSTQDYFNITLGRSILPPQIYHDKPSQSKHTVAVLEASIESTIPELNQPAPLTVQSHISLPVSNSAYGIKFEVGSTIGVFQQRKLHFFPGNTELNQLNIGIVGDLGTGKTQLIQSLLFQLRSQPENNRGVRPRILIFDYKKDYSKPQFIEATGARVVSPFSIPLNIFDTRDSSGAPNTWLERSKFFSDVLDKIFSGIGPLQRQRLKQAVKHAYEGAADNSVGSPTIYDVFNSYTSITQGQIDTPFSIMSDIVDGGYFEKDPSKIQTFSEFLDGVVVLDLGALGQDDRTKNMLVVVFLNLFYEHMLKIEKRPFLGQNPRLRYIDTMLLVDEADNIMRYEFEVLKRILLQGREFGVGVVLSSQYLSHFKTAHENYGEPLLSWFVHKVPNITLRELESIGLARVDTGLVEKIKTLSCHECLYKTYDVGGEFIQGLPFYEILKNLKSV
jgi:DNA phosphorothioation-dependent restriction protein DptH